MQYQNKSFMIQFINTNQGRSLHVHAQEVVDLIDGEELSQEFQSRVNQSPPLGAFLEGGGIEKAESLDEEEELPHNEDEEGSEHV